MYGLAKKDPSTQLLSSDLSESYARDFRSSARTIIHEMGHMFGNKDLYEKASNDKYTPAGGFVMQITMLEDMTHITQTLLDGANLKYMLQVIMN